MLSGRYQLVVDCIVFDGCSNRLRSRILKGTAPEAFLFTGMADKSSLHEDRGHCRTEQHVKRALPDAQVAHVTIFFADPLDQTLLNHGRKTTGLVNLGIGHQVKKDQFKIRNLLDRGAVFTGSDGGGFVVLGEVQVVSFDTEGLPIVVRVGMERYEKICANLVGNGGSLF